MSRTARPHHPPLRLEVLRSTPISPSFRRVTVGGPALAGFVPQGFDQWFRLFVPRPDQTTFRLPASGTELWYPQWLALPPGVRPECRNYTVAAFRSGPAELDVDFVVHRGPDGTVDGVAAGWAEAAQPGDPLGLLDQGLLWDPHPDHDGVLLVADETGVPGMAGVLASLPADAHGDAVLEVPEADDRRPLVHPEGVRVTWVVRSASARSTGLPGAAALEHVRRAPLPSPGAYALAVGESGLAAGVRRHLVVGGHPKQHIRFSGFYKLSD
ncbi:NADPH-dependent ferric siderophore reductase, contains FAD-binding and SIP domains [Friedmanniella luteola]|uniref:NADPH-dependent ferric siderophore reductase, contains FAD-binding and SIP domains n=1 Tax=Friedmanniella luteola TaxID=546871 RepID=A0A1H1ZFU5_9ACTN|nr:siderophore-interacting protein [Friedmanniella luteola]SDT32584.1 NADPH-dependent ferric siderophore reductase, contains FAD-binding and SIP domains [Friedmanniella luteola]